MRKFNIKRVTIILLLVVVIIIELLALGLSRAEKTTEMSLIAVDYEGNLTNYEGTINAYDGGESGYYITLPEIIDTKKIEKYIITQKNTETVEVNTAENLTESTVETTQEKLPGDKIYVTEQELENKQIELQVVYDNIEVNSTKLYNMELTVKDADNFELLSVSGYMPYDTKIKVEEIDITSLESEILQNYPNSFLVGNYNIILTSNENEYIPKEYEQTLNIQFVTFGEGTSFDVLKIEDNQITEIEGIIIENERIKFSEENLKAYLILEQDNSKLFTEEDTNSVETMPNNAINLFAVDGENTKLSIDDYESDKNYYLGLNYTEEDSKTYTGKYTESNLKEVTINYYGYDYDLTEFSTTETYDITLDATAYRSQTGTVTQTGSGRNRYYNRTDTISVTVSGINELKNQYSDFNANSSWTMQIEVPNSNFSNYFYETTTNSENSSLGIAVSVSNGIITVTGNDASSLEGDSDTWTFTFKVAFRSNNRNNITNTTFDTLTVNSFATTITIGEYTPYGTISDTEEQTLVSYRKCVPVDSNGNITIELIDNPFMNRPLNMGFNGWKTNDTAYVNSIDTNQNTFVQTLTTNLNNIIDSSGKYVINLYVDWIEANVIFVSSSGSSSNSGTSPNQPINNDWTTINSKLNTNIKTCTNASNREVNIVVLMNGTLGISGLTGPSTPYTLTSLYDGINYGSTSTYLNVGSTNIQLDSDLQINHLYVYSSASYSSPRGTTDGTSLVSPCIYGNMYNLRIGRGIVPTNNSNCTWAQVQGGYYNHSSNEYKLVIETGQYLTVQLYRAYYDEGGYWQGADTGAAQDTTSNATIVIGNDIDRINNNNENLKIYNRMAAKTGIATCYPYTGGSSKAIAVNMVVKSGTIGVDYFNVAGTSDTSERNYAGIYVGGHGQTGYDKSDRYLLVEGGNIANIIGGLHVTEEDMYKTYMYVKGGNIINITGGAGYTHTYGNRIIQVTGGYVKYSISGGSNGVAASDSDNNGQLTGESLIYIGGTAQIGASSTIDTSGNEIVTVTGSDEVLYGVNAGSVCGGANGNSDYAGQTDGSYIIVDGNAIIHNNIFGGGNYGIIGSPDIQGPGMITFINESSNFTTNKEYLITTSSYGGNGLSTNNSSLTNETMSTQAIPSNLSKWVFENYSGNQYYIKNASTGEYIYIENVSGWFGTYTADVVLSTTNKTALTVQGTNSKTITYTYTSSGWFGGTYTLYLGYNNGWEISTNTSSGLYLLTYEENSSEETQDLETVVNIKVLGGNVKNNIYGGANQNNIYGTVDIDIEDGIVDGTVYGGSNITGTILGSVLLDITGGQLGIKSETNGFDYTNTDVAFGGGLGENTNVNGRVLLNINETKNNLNIYGNTYGGSSLGKINNSVSISIQDLSGTTNKLSILGYVFGGGKGNSNTAAVVTGNVTINADGSNLNNCSVFGGSNINGTINGTITVNVGKTYETILYSVYGGGNQASIGTETQGVYVYLLNNANVTNAFNGGKSADLISAGENDTTRAIYLQGGSVQNLYGGSDSSGTVTVSNVYIESGYATNIYGGNNQGGNTVTSKVNMTNGTVQNIYGGNNQGGTTTTSNVYITGGTTNNVYGGGNQATTEGTYVQIINGNMQNVYAGGNAAGVNTNTNLVITGGTIENNIYGGGNEGTVEGNTYVSIANATIKGSAYAGGNGATAVVSGNTNINIEGNTIVGSEEDAVSPHKGSVFGGGNAAATGTIDLNNSISTVNIVGATIYGNVYGGANTSVVYGYTNLNIGFDAVQNTNLQKSDIYIRGTIFGGGEANAEGSEEYDFSFISVTQGIEIHIDGNGHTSFNTEGSIFGSGNASSTSGDSYITIKNYGTVDNPCRNISIQRATTVTLDNSAIVLSGTTDRTNEYSTVKFTLSRIDELKLKNNSTLYLNCGANLLKKLTSLAEIDGTETIATVQINEETGETIKNVDNRIYMLEGKNLNIATNEQVTAYGEVTGMTFFGIYTSANNPSTSTGIYSYDYNNGDEITSANMFSLNSYVLGMHKTDHNTKIDGFYTNYDNEGYIKTGYIGATPEDDLYYIWVVGEALDIQTFEISLTASKYATLGTYELPLTGYSVANTKFQIIGLATGLNEGISLINSGEIEAIATDSTTADSVFGLSMKSGKNGWQTNNTNNFYTVDGGYYDGETLYSRDNSTFTPSLTFCLYHSQNLTLEQDLGSVRIRFQVMVPVDDLTYDISYMDIIISMSTALFQDNYYEAAISPGEEFDLFTTTETAITNESMFSTYYSLLISDFSENEYQEDYPTCKRVLVSRDESNMPYIYKQNTKIIMLDMATNKYYYYIVTAEDEANSVYMYELNKFIEMGSTNSLYNEADAYNLYYDSTQDLIYENFIFHVDFAGSNITENAINNSLLIELQDSNGETLIGVLGVQRETTQYSIYTNNSATINVDATCQDTIYLGDTIDLNVTTDFTQEIIDSKTIFETKYFNSKMGIKISIFDNNGNQLSSDSLLGINFTYEGRTYYPRIDGSVRIKIADRVSNVLSRIKVNTEHNTTLATGTYTIKIETFGSPDGIYYGLETSDYVEKEITIINEAYGLKVTTDDESKIIDKTTGTALNGNNSIIAIVEYSSGLENPNLVVELQRRKYNTEYTTQYETVNFADYFTNEYGEGYKENEYYVFNNPSSRNTIFLYFKENLITGTYKLVFKLYDSDNYIGEAYEYFIIK